MNKRQILTIIGLLVINSAMANAVIIESTQANQAQYQNGDLIIIDLDTNAPGLEINADFSNADSGYDQRSVLIEPNGERYKITYPITFANTRADNEYNAIITAFDPLTSTTSTVTYGINLENAGQRQQDQTEITIEVINGTKQTEIDIVDGFIQVCRPEGCELLSEEEYDASRQVIVSNGTIQLGDLTYDQLKEEIAAQINTEVRAELQEYLTEIVEIKRLLDNTVFELNELIVEQQNNTNNTLAQTEKLIQAGNRNNIIAIIIVLLLIGAFAYTIYLRTETTWLSR